MGPSDTYVATSKQNSYSSTFFRQKFGGNKKAVSLQRFREIKRTKMNKFKGRLAQLVQSICLTSRGSAVRIRQRPPLNLLFHRKIFGRLAQLVQSICLTSRGSAVRIRQRPLFTIYYFHRKNFGRLAQLVQSICLTSRGSAVRIRQRPIMKRLFGFQTVFFFI